MVDCQLLAEVYLALTRDQVSLLGPETATTVVAEACKFEAVDTSGLNLKIVHPTEIENSAHHAYLTALDKLTHGKSAWFNKLQSN